MHIGHCLIGKLDVEFGKIINGSFAATLAAEREQRNFAFLNKAITTINCFGRGIRAFLHRSGVLYG